MNEELVEQLQTKIAFLEHANASLSEVLYRQQREIHDLAAQVAALARRVHAAQSEERLRSAEEERPPHY